MDTDGVDGYGFVTETGEITKFSVVFTPKQVTWTTEAGTAATDESKLHPSNSKEFQMNTIQDEEVFCYPPEKLLPTEAEKL